MELETQAFSVRQYRFEVQVPKGAVFEILAHSLGSPRLMSFGPDGDLFIGSRSRVYRVPPPYTSPSTLVELDAYPHSVAFRDGELLIARTGGLYRAPYSPGQASIAPADVELLAPLPSGGSHDSRTVRLGPDGAVYVSIGIDGNCSDQYFGEGYGDDDRRGGVLRLVETAGGAQWEAHASGLRNPIGFDWSPTGVMYAANNGPDHLGFEQPPEYFSRLEPGSFHGLPWFYFDGQGLRRDACIGTDPPRPRAEITLPEVTFPARNAPMDVAFVPAGGVLGGRLAGDALVALRGSWAAPPDGAPSGDPAGRREPAIVAVRFDGGRAVRVDTLVRGFQLPDGRRWLRPVGLAFGPDGALYVTSDQGIQGLFRLR